ncbi:head-tail adaptor protein [Wenxinia saemankumensis]|uniref:Head-tail adaptor n=1 Tax=Wenxinia saemankumensis TaxID=1447782 RepID=A0A1M6GMF4_9RHOB|nr:head-tail adaptor protein [Wenxinia saemankumensis]SHJ11147.1 head-tail adaptor [Wenxinia saemankumensis]
MSGAFRPNRRLVLEAPLRGADGAGGHAGGWRALGTLWGAIDARAGRETGGGGGPLSVVTLRITVRAAPWGSAMRPRPEQRLREGARIFTILAVREEDPRGRLLVCEAREEVSS